MNIYFLVEGNGTERKVYPEWLKYLVPEFVQVKSLDKVVENQYYLFSGGGQPRIFDQGLSAAIADVNSRGNFDFLVLCLDVEDSTSEHLGQLINRNLDKNEEKLNSATQLVIIFQNKCFETWFLGNRKIFKRNPSDAQLSKYIEHYCVLENDPEMMPVLDNFTGSIAKFHRKYFELICKERRSSYSKTNPGVVTERTFLNELISRFTKTAHIPSFGRFIQFCEEINPTVLR